MFDVFFYETFEEEEKLLRELLPKEIQAGFTKKTIQEEIHETPISKIISIRTQSKIPSDWKNQISSILTRSTGYDHINHLKNDLVCGYLPKYCNQAVAEHAIMMVFCLLKNLKKQMIHFSSFNRDNLTGFELKDKKIIIFGIGKIGYEIYKITKALGMEVYGVDLEKKYEDVNYISKEEGLKIADIIICAMNLTSDNFQYFNYNILKNSKKGIIFINIARGEMSPLGDLIRLLEEKHLSALALDTYDNEAHMAEKIKTKGLEFQELKLISKLYQRDNVILTPHNAFNTIESVRKKAKQSIEQIQNFLKTGKFIWALN
jgi:D-lactate dehydrogenase